jgi:hypothetical protein
MEEVEDEIVDRKQLTIEVVSGLIWNKGDVHFF